MLSLSWRETRAAEVSLLVLLLLGLEFEIQLAASQYPGFKL